MEQTRLSTHHVVTGGGGSWGGHPPGPPAVDPPCSGYPPGTPPGTPPRGGYPPLPLYNQPLTENGIPKRGGLLGVSQASIPEKHDSPEAFARNFVKKTSKNVKKPQKPFDSMGCRPKTAFWTPFFHRVFDAKTSFLTILGVFGPPLFEGGVPGGVPGGWGGGPSPRPSPPRGQGMAQNRSCPVPLPPTPG